MNVSLSIPKITAHNNYSRLSHISNQPAPKSGFKSNKHYSSLPLLSSSLATNFNFVSFKGNERPNPFPPEKDWEKIEKTSVGFFDEAYKDRKITDNLKVLKYAQRKKTNPYFNLENSDINKLFMNNNNLYLLEKNNINFLDNVNKFVIRPQTETSIGRISNAYTIHILPNSIATIDSIDNAVLTQFSNGDINIKNLNTDFLIIPLPPPPYIPQNEVQEYEAYVTDQSTIPNKEANINIDKLAAKKVIIDTNELSNINIKNIYINNDIYYAPEEFKEDPGYNCITEDSGKAGEESLFIRGKCNIGKIQFKNEPGVILVLDYNGEFTQFSKEQVGNAQIMYALNNSKYNDSKEQVFDTLEGRDIIIGNSYKFNTVKAEDVLIEKNATVNTVKTKDIKLNDSARVENIIAEKSVKMTGKTSTKDIKITGNDEPQVYLEDSATVEGKIIFEGKPGTVYIKSDNGTKPDIKESQIINGKIHVYGNPKGFDRIIGMDDMKQMLKDDVIEPLQNPEKYKKYGIDPINGFLMYGPPGCGKTFVAKMLAEETNRNLYLITPSEVGSKYQFETSKRIETVFSNAKDNAPSIVFIDEAEAIAPERSKLTQENPDYEGVVNELLTQLNNSKDNNVLVIIASNEPQRIDNAIKRTGRMDKKVFIGPPDAETRKGLFLMHLHNVYKEPNIELKELAEKAEYYTAEDIRMVVRKASMMALKEDVPVSIKHLNIALRTVSPSLSKDKVELYKTKGEV